MRDLATEPARFADLRHRATSRLTDGNVNHTPMRGATDALSVLYALASSPETAADALALLHELQVHQVELELQAEELQASRDELESTLRRQVELYDFQPVGCFTIDSRLVVHELNRTAAAMLEIERNEAYGTSLDSRLSAECTRHMRALIANADGGDPRVSGVLQWRLASGPERPVVVNVGADPSAHRYFVTVADTVSA